MVLPEASPFLALDVIKGELIYCNDPDLQAEDELYVLRRAGDLAYYEKKTKTADHKRRDSMTPNRLRAKIIAERSAWISEMITRLRLLPLETLENFQTDRRNPAAAESLFKKGTGGPV